MQGDTKRDSYDVLSKFTVLYWAMFIAVLGHLKSRGCRLDNSSFVFCLVFSHSLCVLEVYDKVSSLGLKLCQG